MRASDILARVCLAHHIARTKTHDEPLTSHLPDRSRTRGVIRALKSAPTARRALRSRGGKFFSRTQKIVDGNFPQLYISLLKGGTSAMAKKKKTTKKSSAKKSTKKKK